jgi:hypothetical protein
MLCAARAAAQSKAISRSPLVEPTTLIAADTCPSPPTAPETTAAKYFSVVSSTPSFSAWISRRAGATTSLAILSSFSLSLSAFSLLRTSSPSRFAAASTTMLQFSTTHRLSPSQLPASTPSILSHPPSALLLIASSSFSREVRAWNCGFGPSRVKPTLWLASFRRLGLLKALAEAAGSTPASVRNAANRMRV